jgi:hypothetical protein
MSPVFLLAFVCCTATSAFAQSAYDPENLSTNARFLGAARNGDAAAL